MLILGDGKDAVLLCVAVPPYKDTCGETIGACVGSRVAAVAEIQPSEALKLVAPPAPAEKTRACALAIRLCVAVPPYKDTVHVLCQARGVYQNGAHEAVGFSLGDLRSKREKGYMKRNRNGNEEPKKSGA